MKQMENHIISIRSLFFIYTPHHHINKQAQEKPVRECSHYDAVRDLQGLDSQKVRQYHLLLLFHSPIYQDEHMHNR